MLTQPTRVESVARPAHVHSRRLARVAGCLLIAAALPAQDIVVPAGCSTLDGRSNGALAGVTQRFRMQVLLDDAALTGVRGRRLTGVSVRRDGQNPSALTGGQATLVVRLSTSSRAPADADSVFARNEGGDATEVFRGVITIPNAPAIPHRHAITWQAPHAAEITFSTEFPYSGGTLCLDVEGSPVANAKSPWWPIDFDLMTHDAQIVSLGVGCDPRARAMASSDTLFPGGTLRLVSTGPAGAVGLAMLSGTRFTPPLPLGAFGATGCVAHQPPDIVLGSSYTGYPAGGLPPLGLAVPGGSRALGENQCETGSAPCGRHPLDGPRKLSGQCAPGAPRATSSSWGMAPMRPSPCYTPASN